MTPLFGRKKEPKEVFDENMRKAKKLYDSPKRWEPSEYKKLLKHIEKAQEIAEEVEVDQEDMVWLWSVKGSVFYMGYHRLGEALECYDKALSINPEDFATLVNKLQVLHGMGKWDEFIKDCDKALELISEARKQIPEGQGPSALGGTMVLSPTVTALTGVDFLDHMESLLWPQKGEALGSLGRAREAFSCFDKAIELDPNNTEAWRRKGGTMLRLERFSEAIECYDKALKINPTDADAWGNKGAALANLGKPEEAIECYDKALKINPKNALVWFTKGIALNIMGRSGEAQECFRKAVEIDPSYRDKIKNLSRRARGGRKKRNHRT